MDAHTATEPRGISPTQTKPQSFRVLPSTFGMAATLERARAIVTHQFTAQLMAVFLAYLIAGKLGQATTNIRSGNLGPVWPASGIALAAVLMYGYRIWPALAASAFLVAFQSPVSALTAAGQAIGATGAAVSGAFLMRRIANFDPALSRLRDALALIVFGAFGSAIVSASIGCFSLFSTRLYSYSGLASAWLIYWLGDATGVLIVTPLVFTLPQLFNAHARGRTAELAALFILLTAACFLVFGDLPLFPIRLHVLAFAVLPFVMWAAIDFGVGGASLSVFLIATAATLLTALGSGPFASNTPFVNAALLDVLFTVLAVSGLALAAVIAERERAEAERERLIRTQAVKETRLHLAAIVDSSNDAVISVSLDGVILSWNAAARRIFGYTEAEAIGRPLTMLVPPALHDEHRRVLERLCSHDAIERHETIRMTKAGKEIHVSASVSALRDADGRMIGVVQILHDISEQKRAQEALSGVSRKLIEAQEQERARIARELHDDIAQRLSLLAVNLSGLAREPVPSLRFHSQTLELQKQASEIAADVQGLSHRLHSSRLELLGITAGMRLFCAEFAEQQKARVEFRADDVPDRLPSNLSLCLFRVLQEALHNAAKHSGAHEFEVYLRGTPGEIDLVVRDHGKGFDVEAARTGRGIGLVSMEERLRLVKGDLSIDSRPQLGTTVQARVIFH